MTRDRSWFGRALLGCAVLIGVLGMHALTGPYPADGAMTGMAAMAETHALDTAPTPAVVLTGADESMCGHTPCVAVLRGHTHPRPPGLLAEVGVLLVAVDAAGVGEACPLPLPRAPPLGPSLTRLCISRT
jgi:hypothetical protein